MKMILALVLACAACGDNIHPLDAGTPTAPPTEPTTPEWCPVPQPEPTPATPDAGVPDAPTPEPGKCEIKLEACQDWCEWKYTKCEASHCEHD